MLPLKTEVAHAENLQLTLNCLGMFAERYLTLESTESSKMSLEITTAWDCQGIPM